MYCFLNGSISRYEDCHLHISDLQLQRGYGIFDFFRIVNGRIPWLEDYTDRLINSLRLAGIPLEMSREEFLLAIESLRSKNGDGLPAFKVLVTGGFSDNLESVTGKANVIIMQVPWKSPDPLSFEKGVNLVSDEYLRPNPEIKTLNYFNALRLQEKMKEYGAVDVLYHRELLSECSRASIFFAKNGQVFTTRNNVLPGITRKQVLSLFPEIELRDLPFSELWEMDEMFLTSSSRDVTPVKAVDGRLIGKGIPGPLTRQIQTTYMEKL